MKKSISLFLCAVFVSALALSGCKSSKDETKKTKKTKAEKDTSEEVIEPDEDQQDYADYSDDSDDYAGRSYARLDMDKYQQVVDLYDTYVPDHDKMHQMFADGIPGSGYYSARNDNLYFRYSSVNGQSSIDISIDTYDESASVTVCLYYGDDRFYGTTCQRIDLDGFESFIDSAVECDTSSFEIYDDSALPARSEDVKKDISIVYSRLISFADNAFPELGFGLEDLGIDLGDKYRSFDPTASTSEEHSLENEHQFLNGVCTDCGMLWIDYFYEAIGIADGDTSDGWRSMYGQDSSYMFEGSDYVQLTSYGHDAEIYFQHMDDDFNCESCKVDMSESGGRVYSFIDFKVEMNMYEVEPYVVDYKYEYRFAVMAELGEYDKIFASKEAFAENCEMYLFVTEDRGGTDVWGSMTDDEIREMFEKDGCTYYTKDEMLDMFWEHIQNYFNSMDAGMVMLDTTLADAGINWK